jgi:hypothetical protein
MLVVGPSIDRGQDLDYRIIVILGVGMEVDLEWLAALLGCSGLREGQVSARCDSFRE